mmetsp:Transcript_2846/g.5333  ORF Transcript_2846/g.5333 Transcript_2846/m.5333 type:complete len:134 (+) Transcript_2846:937-1338(+)
MRSREIKKLREKAIAMQIIRGSCRKRYSTLRKNLAVDFGLKIDKYPVTIDEAVNALNVQEANLPAHMRKGKTHTGFSFAQDGNEKIVAGKNGKIFDRIQCHKCKAKGHYANQCPSDGESEGTDSASASDSQEP